MVAAHLLRCVSGSTSNKTTPLSAIDPSGQGLPFSPIHRAHNQTYFSTKLLPAVHPRIETYPRSQAATTAAQTPAVTARQQPGESKEPRFSHQTTETASPLPLLPKRTPRSHAATTAAQTPAVTARQQPGESKEPRFSHQTTETASPLPPLPKRTPGVKPRPPRRRLRPSAGGSSQENPRNLRFLGGVQGQSPCGGWSRRNRRRAWGDRELRRVLRESRRGGPRRF